MRKTMISYLAALCMMLMSVGLYANNNPKDVQKNLRSEIVSMVSDVNLENMNKDYGRTYVQFLVNAKDEIVVLNVSEEELDLLIKSELNEQKVKTEGVLKNEIYTVPVVFKKQQF